jgi:predicted RNase H-like nuclease (RuvC/YqgF family)
VSRSEPELMGGEAFADLTAAVARALDRMRELEERTRDAESRSGELKGMLERFSASDEAPAQMMERLRRLEEENGEMRRRLEEGRGAVDRLLARIRFLEEKA